MSLSASTTVASLHPEIPQSVLVVHGVLMIALSVFLVYTVSAYSRNVAYTEGLVLFALAFLSVPLVISFDFFFGLDTLANAVRFSGSCLALAGSWFFARDFVRVGTDSGYGLGDRGGFDDGRDD
jgi:uncharacterized membrane protein